MVSGDDSWPLVWFRKFRIQPVSGGIMEVDGIARR
jgi:hypothetical protein